MSIKDVGQRIAKLRKENGWSQMALAEKLNVSDKTVSKWENGGMPGIDLFPEMAKLFNVSIDYLITGNEEGDSSEQSSRASEVEGEEKEDLHHDRPKKYTCPMCNRVNVNPGAHCVYCYHEFDQDTIDSLEAPEEDPKDDLPDVIYDAATKNPICPKCGRVNPYLGDHCVYCYHDFKRASRRDFEENAAAAAYKKYLLGEVPTGNRTAPSTNQLGCLPFIIALLCPLAGFIWGLVKREKGLVLFSASVVLISMLLILRPLIVLLCAIIGLIVGAAKQNKKIVIFSVVTGLTGIIALLVHWIVTLVLVMPAP